MSFPSDPEAEHPQPQPSGNRRRDVRLVVSGLVLALGVWFALANTQEVRIHFWVVSTRTPVVSALAITAVFGVALGLLVGRRWRRPSS
jgi:uncharacterized integral membrane protein